MHIDARCGFGAVMGAGGRVIGRIGALTQEHAVVDLGIGDPGVRHQSAAHEAQIDRQDIDPGMHPALGQHLVGGQAASALNRDLAAMIAHLKDRPEPPIVLFNSNATLLTPAWRDALLDAGLQVSKEAWVDAEDLVDEVFD